MTSSSIRAYVTGLALLAIAAAPAKNYAPYPNPDHGYVTDEADVLTTQEEEQIEQWLIRVEHASKAEIIVVTVRSISDYPGTDNSSIENFATALFTQWGIGNQPKNDGILLLVATKDRNARIELGAGYPASRDADASRIMQNVIVPHFREGDYAAGIKAGVKEIVVEFTDQRIGINWVLIIYPVLIVTMLIIAASLFINGRRGWGWVFVGLALLLLLGFLRALKEMNRFGKSKDWAAGGIGGFGGGFSRGGGATGSW